MLACDDPSSLHILAYLVSAISRYRSYSDIFTLFCILFSIKFLNPTISEMTLTVPSSRLLSLPAELTRHVASFLPLDDVLNLQVRFKNLEIRSSN